MTEDNYPELFAEPNRINPNDLEQVCGNCNTKLTKAKHKQKGQYPRGNTLILICDNCLDRRNGA